MDNELYKIHIPFTASTCYKYPFIVEKRGRCVRMLSSWFMLVCVIGKT